MFPEDSTVFDRDAFCASADFDGLARALQCDFEFVFETLRLCNTQSRETGDATAAYLLHGRERNGAENGVRAGLKAVFVCAAEHAAVEDLSRRTWTRSTRRPRLRRCS